MGQEQSPTELAHEILGRKDAKIAGVGNEVAIQACLQLGLKGDMGVKEGAAFLARAVLGLDDADKETAINHRSLSIEWPIRALFLHLLMDDELKKLLDALLPEFVQKWKLALDNRDVLESRSFSRAASLLCHSETPEQTPFPELFARTLIVQSDKSDHTEYRFSSINMEQYQTGSYFVAAGINTGGNRRAYKDWVKKCSFPPKHPIGSHFARYLL